MKGKGIRVRRWRMTETKKTTLNKLLERKQDEIECQLQDANQSFRQDLTEPITKTRNHHGDTNRQSFFVSQKRIPSLEKCLTKIRTAIERLNSDSSAFGTCQECGDQIDWKRILLVPHTEHCTPCKSER